MKLERFDLSHIKKCEQYWNEMEEVSGGRLCKECSRCIIDFRQKSNLEIAKIHMLSEESVCGLYSDEQWNTKKRGQARPKRISKLILMSLFPTFFVSENSLHAKTLKTTDQIETLIGESTKEIDAKRQTPRKSKIRQDSFEIRGRVFDQTTKEVLIGASVLLNKNDTVWAYSRTNRNGEFNLVVSKDKLFKKLELHFDYIGYGTRKIIIPNYTIVADLQVGLQEQETYLISFGITAKRPLHERIWRKLSWPYRRLRHSFRKSR